MIIHCAKYDDFLTATISNEKNPVEFRDMYRPDNEGNCLNFEFKSDIEKEDK